MVTQMIEHSGMKILESFINFKTFMAVGLLAAGSKVIKNYNSKIVFVPFMKTSSFE